jgi:Ankyrin repeat
MANTHRSMIFTANFHTIRKQIVDCKKPPVDDVYYERIIPRATVAFEANRQWNLLDASIYAADPPFACEIIRLGYPVSKLNANGYTSLITAFEQLDVLIVEELFPGFGRVKVDVQKSRAQTRGAKKRVAFIIKVLIEQHTDLAVAKDGMTALHYACRQKNWDLVSLLLIHGANPRPPNLVPTSTYILRKSDKVHFNALVKKLSGKPRPARLCPCFSGKKLESCHLMRQPYPPEFLCNCGSEKIFARCCMNRSMNTGEQWDPKTNKIITREDPQRNIEDFYDLMELWRAFDGLRIDPPQFSKKEMDKLLLTSANELRDEGKMDPAYAHAFNRTGLLPR